MDVTEEDEELERIKLKLREMFKRRALKKEFRKTSMNKPFDLTDTTFAEKVLGGERPLFKVM